jgi:hypothetical protein
MKEKDVSDYPGLHLRGSMWWVRKKVPVDIAKLYASDQLRKSLRTSSKREAIRLYASALAEIEHEFALKRAELGSKDRITQSLLMGKLERLSQAEIDAMVWEWWGKRASSKQRQDGEYLNTIEKQEFLLELENDLLAVVAPHPDEDDPARGPADQLLIDAGIAARPRRVSQATCSSLKP